MTGQDETNKINRRRRIGVFGGSFDPVHCGHLEVAQAVLDGCRLERIVFIPARLQPHKPGAPRATGADRLRMIELAIQGRPNLEVSDVELRRENVSFTIDTIRELKHDQPDADLFFIVGTDTIADLPRWRRIEELVLLCDFVLVARPGSKLTFDALEPVAPPEALARMRAHAVRTLSNPISSTEIRRRIAEGLPLVGLIPPVVEKYIRERKLYL